MNPILHIAGRRQWERARKIGLYTGDTLGVEGFIHASAPRQVLKVAERFFRDRKGLVLLVIDPEKVRPEIRYEAAGDGDEYPHIYGPLNVDAVLRALKFEPGEDGTFALPMDIIDIADRG